MKSGIIVSLLAAPTLAAVGCGGGETVTFNKDVAPIVFENCASCHRPGGVGPFSLMTYADAVEHAGVVAEATRERFMPPWLPERGEFPIRDERLLTDEQIDVIQRWVKGGALEGEPADLPAPPSFVEGWELGQPDIVPTPERPSSVLGGEGTANVLRS